MDHMRALGLLDSNGKPLGERVQRALTTLLPKVRRQFPSLRDDLALAEVLEPLLESDDVLEDTSDFGEDEAVVGIETPSDED